MNRSNPFPGMDPWLELRWSDVHTALIGFIRIELGISLPEGLVARAEENVMLSGDRFRSDVAVEKDDNWKSGASPAWVPEPGPEATIPVYVAVDEPIDRWLEISTLDGTLVTVIEILSPANKLGDRAEYLRKRAQYAREQINLVEIDLLRDGHSVFELPFDAAGNVIGTDYAVCVKRMNVFQRREVYPMHLRERLSVISIPLRREDDDVTIDLQSMINQVYESGRYATTNYDQPLSPALSDEDDTWAHGIVGSSE